MGKTKTFLVNGSRDMGRVARWLSARFSGKGARHSLILGLVGNLGAGKTTFVKHLAKAYGISSLVASPSFVLLRTHMNRDGICLAHIDAWRITVSGLRQLGFRDLVNNPRAVVCVEWADRVRRAMPSRSIWVYFENVSPRRRKVRICY